jgi:hypothetical protein
MANKNTKQKNAQRKSTGIKSHASARNMAQVVDINTGEDGKKQSLTSHVPIHHDRPVRFKNHAYLASSYRQPKAVLTSSAAFTRPTVG